MTITTRKQAIEDLSMFGIKEPQTYLFDIIPLVEMIWADGEVQESELAILDEYLHERVQRIMKSMKVLRISKKHLFSSESKRS